MGIIREDLSGYAGKTYILRLSIQVIIYIICMLMISRVAPSAQPILTVGSSNIPFIATGIDSTSSVAVSISNGGTGDLSGAITYQQGFLDQQVFFN